MFQPPLLLTHIAREEILHALLIQYTTHLFWSLAMIHLERG